ncbi:hypothetical protein ACTFQM_01995 [Bacillus cereus group sp. MYBK30-2]|uniref:hypothetical protein n=2 Tax=unclassified Bacillus cereus group TaxID=2750818 RepID=UPI003F790A22
MMTNKLNQIIKKYSYPSINGVYLRPGLYSNNDTNPNIFLVGYNPATPIHIDDLKQSAYQNLILSHKNFISYYESLRVKKGKRKQSPTRKRINDLVTKVFTETNEVMFETNIFSYPTSKEKELRALPKDVIEEVKQPFIEMLHTIQPSIIVVHGKRAFINLISILQNLNFLSKDFIFQKQHTFEFLYPNSNKTCTIIPYRHLSRIENQSYQQFQKCLIHEINSKK